MPDQHLEKRREPRLPATGHVRLLPDDPILGAGFQGTLIDLSAGGFRARHSCAAFYPGLEVAYTHSRARGRARVVWNRILGEEVESGFLILSRA